MSEEFSMKPLMRYNQYQDYRINILLAVISSKKKIVKLYVFCISVSCVTSQFWWKDISEIIFLQIFWKKVDNFGCFEWLIIGSISSYWWNWFLRYLPQIWQIQKCIIHCILISSKNNLGVICFPFQCLSRLTHWPLGDLNVILKM